MLRIWQSFACLLYLQFIFKKSYYYDYYVIILHYVNFDRVKTETTVIHEIHVN